MSKVRIEGLVKHFDGKPPTKAIDDINLEIAEGEFLVLLGPSGCGKTTALRCLAGLERPDHGRITFGDDRRCSTRRGGSTGRRTSAASAWSSSRTRCGRT